jgi:hypothetical protein
MTRDMGLCVIWEAALVKKKIKHTKPKQKTPQLNQTVATVTTKLVQSLI